MNRILLLIGFAITLFIINSCGVCDSKSNDFLEFRLLDNNDEDLFLNHTDFNKDSVIVFSTLQNRPIQYTYSLTNSGTDTFYKFSPLEFGNFYKNSKIIIFSKSSISDTISINSKTICGKCGCSESITKVMHEGEIVISNFHVYSIKVIN